MSRRPRWRRPVRQDQGPLRMISRVLTTLFLIVVLGGAWVVWTYRGPGPAAKDGQVTDVVLPRGAGVGQIASALKAAGVIGSRDLFYLAAKLGGAGRSLKAGEYEFRSGQSMASVLGDIAAGKVVKRVVVAPEGWTSAMVADAVRAQPVLVGEIEAPPEGSILPDGYQVQRGEERGDVIARMMAARDALLAQLWAGRDTSVPLKTPEEAVTLASIVEKETGVPAERPRIAAVFENRLRAGIKLESDPTIIYGITKGRPLGRALTHAEVVAPTPYNTYAIAGLPPTPIANPGRASLAAVLNPPRSDELYFVANGTGGHSFATTYEAHMANVERWKAFRRKQVAEGGGK